MYYEIKPDYIVIRPLKFLSVLAIGLAILMVSLYVMTLLMIAMSDSSELSLKDLGSVFLLIPFLLALLPLFVYSRREVIFDGNEKTIYLKTLFTKKTLMKFDQVDNIIPRMTIGIAYYLKSKSDRYGRGYRVSPSFANLNDKEKANYEEHILPEINKIIAKDTVSVEIKEKPVELTDKTLEFYDPHPQGYMMKARPVVYYSLIIGFIGMVALYFIYEWLSHPLGLEDTGIRAVAASVAFIVITGVLTERIIYNRSERKIYLYRMGIKLGTYDLMDFNNFNIVRKTTNGIYSGTDVRMEFNKQGSKDKRELPLKNFKDTSPIERLMDETKLLMNIK